MLRLLADETSLPDHAYDRISSALLMPGVFVVAAASPIGQMLEDILILAECSDNAEWDGRVLYLPL